MQYNHKVQWIYINRLNNLDMREAWTQREGNEVKINYTPTSAEDLDKYRRILEEAGQETGVKVSFGEPFGASVPETEESRKTREHELGQIGITLKGKSPDLSPFWQKVREFQGRSE